MVESPADRDIAVEGDDAEAAVNVVLIFPGARRRRSA
jgi:hypothetical protein